MRVHASVPLPSAGWAKERGLRVDPMRDGVEVSVQAVVRVAWALLWLALAAFAAECDRHVYLKYAALEFPAYSMFLTRRDWR